MKKKHLQMDLYPVSVDADAMVAASAVAVVCSSFLRVLHYENHWKHFLYMKNSENRSHLIFSEILINHLLIMHLHLYPAAGDFLNPDIS